MVDDREHIQLLLRVARLYYEDELDQDEVAAQIGYSRSTVSRLLTDARRRGLVRFVIGHPLERHLQLERDLVSAFGLKGARVAEADDDTAALTAVARAGAEVLVEACEGATVLATSAGTTIDALVQEVPFQHRRELHVVQMIGALASGNPLVDSPEIARRLAKRLGGDYRPMPAPLIVGSRRLAQALKREEAVANALALASHADVALVGIGALTAQGVSGEIFRGWLTSGQSKALAARGAVGHISGQHFDAAGRHLVSELSELVMSVPLERLGALPAVIGVATGQDKVAAIMGAARGGYISMLVTDAATASAVLRMASDLR